MRRISFLESGMKVSLPSVCSSSIRRALCLLHVELYFWMENSLDCSVMCTCRCGWMGTLVELELELELKNPVGLLRVE